MLNVSYLLFIYTSIILSFYYLLFQDLGILYYKIDEIFCIFGVYILLDDLKNKKE